MKTNSSIKATKSGQFNGHEGSIYTLEQAHSPSLFYSGSSDNMVVQWDMENPGQHKVVATLPAKAFALKFIADKNLLLVGQSMGGIHVIDLNKKKEIKLLQIHRDIIFDIRYIPAKEYFIALCGDGTFSVWSINDFSLITSAKVSDKKLRNLDINLFRNEAAMACGDGVIRIYDLDTFILKQTLHGHAEDFSVNTLKYHPNRNMLLSGSRDAHLNIWDLENNYELIQKIPAHNFAIYDIVFSPDEELFATGSRDKTIKIWNANNYELVLRIDKAEHDSHTHSVNKLLWSNYNDYLISTGDDKTILVWKISIQNLKDK